MATIASKSHPHWNYLLALDTDLAELSRYIEFDEKNFACFSLELARVLFSAASEVDVVAKQICTALRAESAADNIHNYRDEIYGVYPNIVDFTIVSPRFSLEMLPWAEWKKSDGVPSWWSAYNKVKHQRHAHYEQANLKNTLKAVAGLLVLVLYLYKESAEEAALVPSPQILRVHDDHIEGITAGEYYKSVWYKFDVR